jgi:hypothetical protein
VIQMTSKQQFCCLEIGKSCIYDIHAHFPPHWFPIMMQYRAGQYLVGVQVFGSVLKKKNLGAHLYLQKSAPIYMPCMCVHGNLSLFLCLYHSFVHIIISMFF